MAQDETYNGWKNRETWLVALWINNEQGWQEQVHEAVAALTDDEGEALIVHTAWTPAQAYDAGKVIRENVEEAIWGDESPASLATDLLNTGLERADWTEIGASFLQSASES